MRRRITTVAVLVATAVVLATLCGTALAAWPPGVFNYCGFEGHWDEAGWRDLGWGQGGTPGMSFDHKIKRYGKASLRIVGAAGQTREALDINGVPVEKGKHYVLRAWIKTQDVTGDAALALQPHAGNKPLSFVDLGKASRLTGTHDWTLVKVNVPPLPPGSTVVYPYVWLKGPGTAWFDEVALTLAGVHVPLGGQKPITEADYAGVRFDDAHLPANLLKDPGFEDGLKGWYVEHGKPAIDEAVHASGQRSLRFDGFPECNYTVVQIGIRIDPHRAYRLSFEVKTDLTAGLSCAMIIPFKASGQGFGWWFTQDHTDEFCYGRGRQGWHEVSVVLRKFRPETDYINVYLMLQDAVGKVWFDDVRLTPLSTAETREVRGR